MNEKELKRQIEDILYAQKEITLAEGNSVITAYLASATTPPSAQMGAVLVLQENPHEIPAVKKEIERWLKATKQSREVIDISENVTKEEELRLHLSPASSIFVLPQTAFTQEFHALADPLIVVQGSKYKRSELITQLVAGKFVQEQRTMNPGTFTVSGDTINIMTWRENLVTLTLFGAALETLTQNGEPIDKTTVAPSALGNTTKPLQEILNHRIALVFTQNAKQLPDLGQAHTIQTTIDTNTKHTKLSTQQRATILKLHKEHKKNQNGTARPPRLDMAFLGSLKVNDYVVHRDHGIGIFLGRKHNTIDKIEKEFFEIEYDQGDKLFVPITYAGKLTKYIGSPNPAIHRIGGTAWNKARKKVQKDAENIARELLQMYAKREKAVGFKYPEDSPEMIDFENAFPYTTTPDQQQAIDDVKRDMENDHPMDRLICGDVGFGKTEVAMRASHKAAQSGKQIAVLAPTTILAQQHFDTFQKRFAGTPIRIGQLSRFESPAQQKVTIDALAKGDIHIVVGTHRILSKDVAFNNLGMLIIDEEQRFGVKHKEHFKNLRTNIDILTLSATPIPRTLNMAVSGFRNISVIRTPPPSRQQIETHIEPFSPEKIRKAIEHEHRRGGQTYYVYNKVETIEAKRDKLQSQLDEWDLPLTIGIAHGQLPEKNLAQTIKDFDAGDIDILLASTIIQNGIDLPNVNTIVIENAPEFGLTQLYQLKGRIGRGARQGYAHLFYKSQKLTNIARERLHTLKDADHLGAGFEIAMRDMEIRGTGNLLGKEQSGNISAVGMALYSNMLEQAVERLQHIAEDQTIPTDPRVDLPLPTFIPEDFTENTKEQLGVVETITQAQTPQELSQRRTELLQKHSTLPQEIENIIHVVRIGMLAATARVVTISTTQRHVGRTKEHVLALEFADTLSPEKIGILLKTSPHWEINPQEKTASLALKEFGGEWITALQKLLEKL